MFICSEKKKSASIMHGFAKSNQNRLVPASRSRLD